MMAIRNPKVANDGQADCGTFPGTVAGMSIPGPGSVIDALVATGAPHHEAIRTIQATLSVALAAGDTEPGWEQDKIQELASMLGGWRVVGRFHRHIW
jgi:hypothetical protein